MKALAIALISIGLAWILLIWGFHLIGGRTVNYWEQIGKTQAIGLIPLAIGIAMLFWR